MLGGCVPGLRSLPSAFAINTYSFWCMGFPWNLFAGIGVSLWLLHGVVPSLQGPAYLWETFLSVLLLPSGQLTYCFWQLPLKYRLLYFHLDISL